MIIRILSALPFLLWAIVVVRLAVALTIEAAGALARTHYRDAACILVIALVLLFIAARPAWRWGLAELAGGRHE